MKNTHVVAMSLLASVWSAGSFAEVPTATMKQLAAEAKTSTVAATDNEPAVNSQVAPAAMDVAANDPEVLVEQITRDLESYLKVAPDQPIKKDAVVEVAAKAQARGNAAADIQRAVSDALNAMSGKGIAFEPGTLAFIQISMRDLLSETGSMAQGDPADAYIRSLNAELATTRVTTAGGEVEKVPAAHKFSMASQKGPKGTITVIAGESLSDIAHRIYGDAALYPIIFNANRDQLSSPNVVDVGQVLRIPPLDSARTAAAKVATP